MQSFLDIETPEKESNSVFGTIRHSIADDDYNGSELRSEMNINNSSAIQYAKSVRQRLEGQSMQSPITKSSLLIAAKN